MLNLNARIDIFKMKVLPRIVYLFQSMPVTIPTSQFIDWDKKLSQIYLEWG